MKETSYCFGKAKVTIFDPSSNEERKPRLEKAVLKFFDAVERERIEKERKHERL